MKLNKQILTKLVKEEKAKLLQGTHTYGTGDIVKDINPDCPHHGAEGKVTKVGKGTITFIVTNNGKNYKEGDELEKTEDQMVKLTTEGKLTEAKETPQVGDEVILVASSYYSHEIIQISGSDVIVDNKKGRKAPAVILGKKNDKMGFYKPKFKIKINNLKKSGASWYLKSAKRAIDGKDLEFEMMGRGKVFGYVNEAKLTEGKPKYIFNKNFGNEKLHNHTLIS